MTAKSAATLKAQFVETDGYDRYVDTVDTIVAPQDTVTFAGAATVTGTLTASGAATVTGKFTANGSADFNHDLVADGTATFSGPTTISGTTTLSGALTISGATTVSGNMDVTGEFDAQQGFERNTWFEIFDDFLYQAITENDNPWILNSGGSASDPAINAQAGGVLRLSAGTASGNFSADGVQAVGHIPVQASSGGLMFETRLHINTAITKCSVVAGFTDVTSLEEPFNIASGDVGTSTCSDGAAFVYDADATTKGWFAMAVDSNADDTDNGTCGVAPVADTYQVLRLEISSGGGTCTFYINGVSRRVLSNAGVTPNVSLYPTVVACSTGTAARTIDEDYIRVGHTR